MKTILIVIGVLAFGALIWVGIVLTASPTPVQQTPTASTNTVNQPATTPSGANTVSTGTSGIATTAPAPQPLPDQDASAGTQPEIAKSMSTQIQNANLITLKGTAIVSIYALQIWGDENKGGEALLRYDSTHGWVLLSMGGGLWAADGLVAYGVPQTVAEQLVANLHLQ